jgi:hypothetical protein
MEEQQKPVVNIDGTEYNIDELPDNVKGVLAQIHYTREQLAQLQVEFQNFNMMQRGYVVLLQDLMTQWKEGETVVE